MLDLAVRLGVVAAILHDVEIASAHGEGFERVAELRARDEGFGVGLRGDARAGIGGDIDAFGLAIPDIRTAIADIG